MSEKTQRQILMVSVTPFKGGGETHDAKLAEILIEKYRIHAIVSNAWLQDQMEGLGISVTRIRSAGLMGRYVLTACAILKRCLLSRPNAVHLNGQGEAYFAPLFRLLGLRTVIARHGFRELGDSWIKRIAVDGSYRLGTKVVCVSSAVRRDMESVVKTDRLVTISNWLTDREMSQPRQFTFKNSSFKLLFVGRLVPFKSVRDLVGAMRFLDGCSLQIVGDGPDREELMNRARGLPIAFVGLVDDCASYYDRADLLVFPSSHLEAQGQTPLEAMARGLPCLVSDIEATTETTDSGRVAGMFRQGDVKDLVRQIRRLRDPELRTKLSHSGFERVRDHYSVAVVRPLYFQLFDELTGA